MKQKILFLLALSFVLGTAHAQSNAQSEKQTQQNAQSFQAKAEPMAVVTYSKTPQPSQLILKVKSLCQGDERLTEMVIAEIYKRKDLQIKDVITDAEFKLLSRDEQNEWVCESEVNEIINLLKR